MKIFISADHNGFELKNTLHDWLKNEGHEISDLGPDEFVKEDDYPDFGIRVAQEVARDPENNFGILICGSGVGMAVVADKVRGVRAGLIHDPAIAESARRDDDINVLALGANYIEVEEAKKVINAWLGEKFSGAERHIRRINKIGEYEKANSCGCELDGKCDCHSKNLS